MRFDNFRKTRIFRQEAITGMDSIGVSDFTSCDDCRDIQIAIRRAIRANADRFVCEFDMHGVSVSFGMDGDSGNAHFFAGAMNTQCNLAAIGDEDFFEQALVLGICHFSGLGHI